MAKGHGRRRRKQFPKRTSMGTYELHGSESDTRLTISSDLDHYQFPNHLGTEVEKIVVEEEDGYEYIELHPTNDDDEAQ